jgi:hypothetical protein
MARRLFPTPGGPTTVTADDVPTRRASAVRSRSRPTKLVLGSGRLWPVPPISRRSAPGAAPACDAPSSKGGDIAESMARTAARRATPLRVVPWCSPKRQWAEWTPTVPEHRFHRRFKKGSDLREGQRPVRRSRSRCRSRRGTGRARYRRSGCRCRSLQTVGRCPRHRRSIVAISAEELVVPGTTADDVIASEIDDPIVATPPTIPSGPAVPKIWSSPACP